MLNYLYLDYGGKPKYRAELKYSLVSLKAELDLARARIVVATDAPEIYRAWPVTVMDIGPHIRDWSGGGLYYHRIKPALVREALARLAEPVLFLDSDSIVRPGFHTDVADKMGQAVVVNRFEKMNPIPALKGFRTALPHLGAYRYDVTQSRMYNSGLIGMTPSHIALLDDSLAMIDALIGRAKKFPNIEQFALSEVLRLTGTPVAEIHDSFLHYWQGRRRIYMANQIAKSLSPDWNDLTPPSQWAEMNYWKIRAYNYYHGVTHVTELFK